MYLEFSSGKNCSSSGISGYTAVQKIKNMSGLCNTWKAGEGRGRVNTSKKSRDPAMEDLCGYKELPGLWRIRVSARMNGRNGDHLLRKPE